jgi:dTMP kinase
MVFIVLEGIDGSGKATQTKLLVERLRREGYKVETLDFPQYGTKSAGPLENYLNGKYGSAEEVSPYVASIFYACDRYDASSKIRKWLKEGKIVIADRYIASNIGHQGGKIKDLEERKRYIDWLYDLEYNLFKIPKPDATIILKTSPEIGKKLVTKIVDKEKERKKKAYLGDKKRDIHEENIDHLSNTLNSYLDAAKMFSDEFRVVECLENGELLPPEKIHQKVWNIVKDLL